MLLPTTAAEAGEAAAEAWAWNLPPGFPEPAVPASERLSGARVELGRQLFYDERLSGDGTFSCASCHRQALAFTDGRARAVGATGALHPRGAMSLANVAWAPALGWADPDTRRLDEQAAIPLSSVSPVEMGAAGREREIEARLTADAHYRDLFARAFPGEAPPISLAMARRAIAAFERTLISADSPYDRLVYRDDTAALSDVAREGMRLFFSERLGCGECHGGPLFAGPMRHAGAPDVEPAYHNTGLYDVDGEGGYPAADTGLHQKTGRNEDMGRFRAPTLRNIAVTGPYMHDGSIASLEEVIAHYAAGGRAWSELDGEPRGRRSPLVSAAISGFVVTPEEVAALVAFLEHLTDERFLGDPRFADPESRAGVAEAPPGDARVRPPGAR
jgi:cytochrome c peroxidase